MTTFSKQDSSQQLNFFPSIVSTISSVKSTLAQSVLGIDCIYTTCQTSSFSWLVEISSTPDIFEWFVLFSRSNFKAIFNNCFNQSRSIFSNSYESNGQPIFSFFIGLFTTFRIIIVDRPSNYTELSNLLTNYGSSVNSSGYHQVTQWQYFLFQLGVFSAGKTASNFSITNYLGIMAKFIWSDFLIEVDDLIKEDSKYYIYFDSGTTTLFIKFFSKFLMTSKNPNGPLISGGSISFFDLLAIPSDIQIIKWYNKFHRFITNTPQGGSNACNTIDVLPNSFGNPTNLFSLCILCCFKSIPGASFSYGILTNCQSVSTIAKEILVFIIKPTVSFSEVSKPSGSVAIIEPCSLYTAISATNYKNITLVGLSFTTVNEIWGFSKSSIDQAFPIATRDRITKRSKFIKPAPKRDDEGVQSPPLPLPEPTISTVAPPKPLDLNLSNPNAISIKNLQKLVTQINSEFALIRENSSNSLDFSPI